MMPWVSLSLLSYKILFTDQIIKFYRIEKSDPLFICYHNKSIFKKKKKKRINIYNKKKKKKKDIYIYLRKKKTI